MYARFMKKIGASISEAPMRPNPRLASQHAEPILEPELPIIDPHHHYWDKHPTRNFISRYMIEELSADVASGHNVVKTVCERPPPRPPAHTPPLALWQPVRHTQHTAHILAGTVHDTDGGEGRQIQCLELTLRIHIKP
jgi:hypothetical protein